MACAASFLLSADANQLSFASSIERAVARLSAPSTFVATAADGLLRRGIMAPPWCSRRTVVRLSSGPARWVIVVLVQRQLRDAVFRCLAKIKDSIEILRMSYDVMEDCDVARTKMRTDTTLREGLSANVGLVLHAWEPIRSK